MNLDDFCFVVYTNESYIPILNLTFKEFDKFLKDTPIKKYVVSNKFTEKLERYDYVEYFESGVNFSGDGGHFAQTFLKFYNNIKQKYIIFFCDDYLLLKDIDLPKFYEFLNFYKENKFDMFTFCSQQQRFKWEVTHTFNGKSIFSVPETYMYAFSVQPCIWNKDKLLEILNVNSNMTLHHLDTGCFRNPNNQGRVKDPLTDYWGNWHDNVNYNFKTGCADVTAYDDHPVYDKYFLIPYTEIIRHAKFNLEYQTHTKSFLLNYLKEKNILNNPEYKKFL